MEPITFKIPVVPVTYNANININYNTHQIYLSKKAREFKRLVKLHTPDTIIPCNIQLTLYVEIHSPRWFTKEGKIRRIDIQNLDKLLIDSIASKMGFDDSQIFDSRFVKEVSPDEFTLVLLNEYHYQN